MSTTRFTEFPQPEAMMSTGYAEDTALQVIDRTVFGKRTFDVLFALAVLILVLPVIAVLAILIKLDSEGPVFYRSKRVGLNGELFDCWKLRTMVTNAEDLKKRLMHLNERNGVLFKITNDPRITRLGRVLRKFSLDELPQLWNVLTGDMSIVGPRPAIPAEVEQYEPVHLRRLLVKPGLTGLWQVMGRKDPSFENYIGFDLEYVETCSFWLDMSIIARTFFVVFQGTGE